jgi:hypothetical protein
VHLNRPGVARLISYVVLTWFLSSAAALAEVTTVEGMDAPIVRIQIPAQANVTIRMWDRNAIQIEGDSSAYAVDRSTNRFPANLPPTLIRIGQIKGPDGPILLPAESFVVSSITPGPHSVVVVRAEAGHDVGQLVVTVPRNSSLIAANVARGSIALHDYQSGTFILHVNTGAAVLDNVGGDGFVQVLRGPLLANDSTLNRLRVRTALGNQIYERCNVRQIEASSVEGSIVYDGGRFGQGLARFDSTNGNVAIGVAGGAQLGARVGGGGGRVYTFFEQRAQIDNRDDEATAVVGGGGPVVMATSGAGNVYLYDGSLRNRARLPAEWRQAQAALRNEPVPRRPNSGGRPFTQPVTQPTPQPRPEGTPRRTPPRRPPGNPPAPHGKRFR